MSRDFVFLILSIPAFTPAKAQSNRRALATLDPGFRRDDEKLKERR